MYRRISYTVLLLFSFFSTHWLYGQAYQDFGIYAKSGTMFIYNETETSGKYVNKTDEKKIFSGNFDASLMYSLFYNSFYLSFVPQFKMQNVPQFKMQKSKMQKSESYFLLKEFLLSYSFDSLDIGLGKTKENRYLTRNRDYLTVRNRSVAFNDEFSFWKLNMYVPTEYVSIELGSKIIREEKNYNEWEEFDNALVKPYFYTDFDYAGFSSHLGYAYTYDIPEEDHIHDITGKIFYNYNDIITGYFANLISFEQEKTFSLEDYSYTIGSDFSFLNAFGVATPDYDVKITTELIYEKEDYSIIPSLLFFYNEFVFVNTFSYTFDDTKKISNRSVIQYTAQDITFRVFNVFSSYLTDKIIPQEPMPKRPPEKYTQDIITNTSGVEVVYEM